MNDKKYLSELITDEDIIQNPVTCIVAGLGSGKSTWVEGIHNSSEEVEGLVDRYNALYITSRRSKVDESHQNNPKLLKSIDTFFEHQWELKQRESVACTFAHLVEYIKRSRGSNPWFWRAQKSQAAPSHSALDTQQLPGLPIPTCPSSPRTMLLRVPVQTS